MVCAICGRMPLMMQSAPISRAAATVLSRCCATSVSTVGTPVMSMMAIAAPGLDDLLQQALHHHLRAGAVERADQRQREDVVPQLHHRRGQLEQLLLLAHDHLLAAVLVHLGGEQAELVEQQRGAPGLVGELRGPGLQVLAQAAEQRLLEREDEGRGLDRREALRARAAERSASRSRVAFQCGASVSGSPACSASTSERRKPLESLRISASPILSRLLAWDFFCSSIHSASTWSSCVRMMSASRLLPAFMSPPRGCASPGRLSAPRYGGAVGLVLQPVLPETRRQLPCAVLDRPRAQAPG